MITYAGFFALSDNPFFLLLSFLFFSPLKNDGTSELRFQETVNDFSPKKKSIGNVSRPGHGEGGGEAVGRGKCEQTRKTVFTERH